MLNQKLNGLSSRTLQEYKYHIGRFFEQTNPETSNDLKLAVLKYFADSADLSPYTFNTRRKKLKTFFKWLINEGFISENPMNNIKKRKEDLKPKPIDISYIEQLIKLPDKKTFVGIRDYALLLLSMDTGIRPSEALQLMPEDVNLKLMFFEACDLLWRKQQVNCRLLLVTERRWMGIMFTVPL